MKLNFTANKRQGQTTLRAVIDFFFPLKRKIRIEAKTNVILEKGSWKVTEREFFTFQAFAWHYILIVPHLLKVFLIEYKNALDACFLADPYFYQKGAIAVDVSTSAGTTALYGNTGGSFTHTCTGSNLTLVVGISLYAASTSVTYAGSAMTQQALATRDNLDGFTLRSYQFTKASPATGANSVTTTNATPEQTTGYGSGIAISFSGTNTTTPVDATNTANGSDTTPTVTVTTVNNNSFVVDNVICENTSTTATIGAGQTSIHNIETANGMRILASYEQKVTAGATVMDWTLAASRKWASAGVAINEATGVVKKVRPTLLTLKVG